MPDPGQDATPLADLLAEPVSGLTRRSRVLGERLVEQVAQAEVLVGARVPMTSAVALHVLIFELILDTEKLLAGAPRQVEVRAETLRLKQELERLRSSPASVEAVPARELVAALAGRLTGRGR